MTTTPTGDIGSQLLRLLIDRATEPVRVIVRDPARLPDSVRDRVDVVTGSHGDADVLDRAFDGADAVFWLVPPDPRNASVDEAYAGFSAAAAAAFAAHRVEHVVGISALGRGTPVADRAGLVTATLAVDDLIAASGTHYRALACAGFMDNVLRSAAQIRDQGEFGMPVPEDRSMPLVATADIAAAAADLLLDRSWDGVAEVPLLGPSNVTPTEMVATMSDVLDRPVRYEEQTLDEVNARTRGYATDAFAQAMVDMMWAKQNGLDDAATRVALSGSTTFRQWCEQVLRPAVLG